MWGLLCHGQGLCGSAQPQPEQHLAPSGVLSQCLPGILPSLGPLRFTRVHSCALQAGLPGYCRGLCWRPFSPGMPPMLCVGVGQQVCVWQYVLALNTWQVGQGQCATWAAEGGRCVGMQG